MFRTRHALAAVATLTLAAPTLADPPPDTPHDIPPVFCFRITDIELEAADPQLDRFRFQFEHLNWTGRDAGQLLIAPADLTLFPLVVSGLPPFMDNAAVDSDGRPFGGNDDANFAPVGPIPGKVGMTNNWTPNFGAMPTAGLWVSPSAASNLPARELIMVPGMTAADRTLVAISRVPGAVNNGTMQLPIPGVPDFETVDNGGYAGEVDILGNPLPDNVLDGFVIEIDDFDPGEIISFNWFLLDGFGQPIGTSQGGNAFGFGTFTILRVDQSFLTTVPLWQRMSGPANSGTVAGPRDLFPPVLPLPPLPPPMLPVPPEFEFEFGAQLTVPFEDPGIPNIFELDPNPSGGPGIVNGGPLPRNPKDFNFDGCVDLSDLAVLLSNWQMVSPPQPPFATIAGDCNADGIVDLLDLQALLMVYGTCN